jgi:hypothetical protein
LDGGEAAFAVGLNAGKAIIGSAMFSSSSLAPEAMEIATSAPIIRKQTG